MAKISLSFNAFEDYAEKLDKIGGNLEKTIEECLLSAYDYVTPKLETDIKKHNRLHTTEKSIDINGKVTWSGTLASIDVGFNIKNGGLPSIFLMYGTPRAKPDKKLYNDIYGSKTKKEISTMQEEIFLKEIEEVMRGRNGR